MTGGDTEVMPIGQRLRVGRERVGLSAEQVAQSLHLNVAIVTALEAGDFDSLGAPIFIKGHLRNYARLVKLDADEIIAAYEVIENTQPPDLPARAPRGVRMDERSGWGSRVAWAVLVVIVAAIGYWLYQTGQLSGLVHVATHPASGAAPKSAPVVQQPLPASRNRPQAIARLPAATSHAAPPANTRMATPRTGAGALPSAGIGGSASAAGALPGAASVANPVPAAAQPAAAEQGQQAPLEQVRAAEAQGGLSLALRLTGDSWVEVDDRNGKRLYYGLARNGQTLYLSGQPPLHVFLGNAPDVRVLTAGRVINTMLYTRSDNTARFTIHQNDGKPPFAGNPEGEGAPGPGG